ncbi:branched-chain amino acid ABC transporter permease [Alphaproteobacteria bacterium KMM 3653]|uniref:Branched-chain amino acid ABC transporter permease n=1 Tax=Harenicola maris TaxID=2841044 RepID=A0AAP2G883_9RHOB|nr:branched-chain amino acid ABC transporter permease [Harenicola maris]
MDVLQQLISGLMLGSLYALLAVAFTLVIGVLNFLNFSIPGIFMMGGMISWGLMSQTNMVWWLAMAIALAACVVASLLVERFTYRFMKMRFGDATEHATPLVSSLGFLILFQGLVLIKWGPEMQYFPSPWQDPNLRIGELVIGLPQLASLILALVLVGGLSLLLARTGLGRAIRAIAESPDTAAMLGIRVNRIVPAVFIISGLLAGLAGVLFSLNYLQASPRMGDEIATLAISAMVLGGLGSVWGAVIGGLFLGLVQVMVIQFFGAEFLRAILWGLLLVIIVVRPQGVFGGSKISKGKF